MGFLIFGYKASPSLTSLQILSIHYTLLSNLPLFHQKHYSMVWTLTLVNGFIQTYIYSKPTDNHIHLLKNSTHPAHCTKAISFNQGYNPMSVQKQFEKAKSIPMKDLLIPKV